MALVDNVWYVDGSTGITVNDLTTANNSATATLTLSITVPAGALIVVVVNEATSTTAGTCADATNGAYTAGPTQAISGAAGILQIFYFANSAALSAVTLTYTKQTSGRVATLSAFYATGIATSTPLDTAVTASTAVSGAAPTVTSGTPAVSGELIVGAYGSSAAAGTFTQPANTAFLAPVTTSQTQATANVAGGNINVNGNLAVTYAPTTGNAVNNALIVVGFKAASTPSIGWYGVTKWAASTTKVTGNLVIQNATPAINGERVFVCVASTAGTGQTAATEPAWQTTAQCTRGAKFTDNTVIWQEATGIAALNGDATNTPSWTTVKASAPAVLGQVIAGTASGTASYMICTTPGTMGAAEPTWPAFTNAGATVTETAAVAVWTNIGAQSNFTGWQAPHARLANSFASTWGQAGNSFFVANVHAETQSSNTTLTSPGSTLATLCPVYSVNTANVPPTSANLAAGASIRTMGNSGITIAGVGTTTYIYFYGITFINASGANNANFNIQNSAGYSIFNTCALQLGGLSGGAIVIGSTSSGLGIATRWINTTMQVAVATSGIASRNADLVWHNTATAITGATLPTTLFISSASQAGSIILDGVDLSALGSGKTIVADIPARQRYVLQDCKLGASVTIAVTPSNFGNAETVVIRADSSGTNYRHEKYHAVGTQTVETTIIRTGGASDGTTSLSWKVVSTANSKWVLPFECIPITVWCDTTGSHTVTVYGTTTGGGVPNNDDIWITAEYLKDSGDPLGGFVTTTKSDNLAASTTTNNSSDASTWGGGGAGNGFKMVTPSFTVNQKGPITVYVYVAKATTTYYVDPRPSISGITVNRSLILAPGVYANELGGGSGSFSYIS